MPVYLEQTGRAQAEGFESHRGAVAGISAENVQRHLDTLLDASMAYKDALLDIMKDMVMTTHFKAAKSAYGLLRHF